MHGRYMNRSVQHSKVVYGWCDTCGTLILGKECSECNSKGRDFEVNSPGDTRPCMGSDAELVRSLFKKHFGTSGPLNNKLMFLNKIAGDDRTDEIIVHGQVIGVLRFDIVSSSYALDLRQAGAEIFSGVATKNIVKFEGLSGHLKGKSIPGEKITEIIGEFSENDPLIVKKGGKVGPGVALGRNTHLKGLEKAVRIKDLLTPSESFNNSRKTDYGTFVKTNKNHLRTLESNASSDVKSFIRGKSQPLTVSFSGGKDSLAALGVALNVTKNPILMFINTGLEFPETSEYVKNVSKKMNLALYVAEAGDAFKKNVKTFGPPAKDFRWCCKVCKLGPITDLISEEFPNGTITVEGNRALESFARSNIGFVGKNPFVPNQTALNPIRKWSAAEVWGYIWMKGLDYNPLYEKGFERIGCHLCASCLSSEWRETGILHPDIHQEWEDFLKDYAESKGLPKEYAELGFWRWKVLPPKMVKLAEGLDMKMTASTAAASMKMLKGASPCAAGGYSMEAVVTLPRNRDFSAIEDSLRTIGDVRYSEEFEVALLKLKSGKGTAKLFGGGQVSITAKNAADAEDLFERSVKALLRSQMCTECGICVKACPRHAIKISKGFHVDKERCISCGKCEKSCMVMHYFDKMV